MSSKFLMWIDILGFEELGKQIAKTAKVSERKVRGDFTRLINEKIEEEKGHGIIGENHGEGDDWLLAVDSLDNAFKVIHNILDHNTEYQGYEKIPLEIALGVGQFDKSAKLDGQDLVNEGSTIDFLKTHLTDYFRKWYKQKYSSSVTASFVILTEAVYKEMNPFEKEFCEKIEYCDSSTEGKEHKISLFEAELPSVLQRGLALRFLEKVGKSPSSSFRRIERIFVPPDEYNSIIESLEKNKVVFIVGDPEIGKTYTAARIMWEYYLKGYDPVWHSGAEPQERAKIRKKLSECEVLNNSITYFEDPFGKVRFEDREELRRTIDCVISRIQSLDSYVIITSREEVFKEFEKEKLSQNDLREFTVEMRLMKPSYGDEKMEHLLVEWATEFECKWLKNEDLKSSVILLARNRLRTPLSLWDFALTSRNDVDAAKIIQVLNEKSTTVKAAFAEEIAQMSTEKILFLSLAVILNPLKKELIKPVFNELGSGFNLRLYPDSFERLQNQFSEKISLEERHGGQGTGFYFRFMHPSYEEGVVNCWNRQEIKGLVLQILNSLIENNNPIVRGCCGLCLMLNLSAISIKKEAYDFINRVLHDKNAITRYGVAEAITKSFQNIPIDTRVDYLKLLLKDRHREIRAASIETVSHNFKNIPLKESLDIISIGLEDRAAYVRFATVQCVESNMTSLPKKLVLRALEIQEKLCSYSGWFINYFSNMSHNQFKEEFKQRFEGAQNSTN
jgi:hypothetical protein